MTVTIPLTLGTKAQTLQRLRGLLSTAEVPGQFVVTVAQWRTGRNGCLDALQRVFPSQRVIVRSSAPGEDSDDSTCAGMYASVQDVPTESLDELGRAVAEVIDSYARRHGDDIGDFELLVQPMLTGVTSSGVAFGRDLATRAPYLVVSYDDSGRTDTVTSGADIVPRVVRIRHGADAALLEPPLAQVAATVAELVSLLGRDDLDVEWAVSQGRLVVLQVRPLPGGAHDHDAIDDAVAQEVASVKRALRGYGGAPRSGMYGSRTAWSTMADWNPAEMIGAHPRPLALSLYQRLITREVWRQARGLLGYHNPAPHQLMITLAGRPYIDLRADFSSYLPTTLGDELCHKLIDCYLDRLAAAPEAHDKVEFEICPSALDADFPRHAAALADAGLASGEIDQVRSALLRLTMDVFHDRDGQLAAMHERIGQLPERRRQLLATAQEPLVLADALLTDARDLGTLPFATTVRATFVATALWRSLLRQGVITQAQHDGVLASVRTVASDFSDDLARCQSGELPLVDFLATYGHLRPGTYDITVPSYAAAPELYIGRSGTGHAQRPHAADVLPPRVLRAVDAALARIGLGVTASELVAFVREMSARREAYKFAFSANISSALDALAAFGRRHDLDADRLSYLTVEDLLGCVPGSLTSRDIARLCALSQDRHLTHDAQRAVRLPDVIIGDRDVDVVIGRHRPNFVTAKRVTAPAVLVTSRLNPSTALAGRIVLTEHADPGYEFLFSRDIAGLITRYGGAASHMAIRCTEIGIPAAIGVGDAFTHLSRVAEDGYAIALDCAQQLIIPATSR